MALILPVAGGIPHHSNASSCSLKRRKEASLSRFVSPLFGATIAFLGFAGVTQAQVVTVPDTPQIGSSNPITADPLVPRPPTKPCIVQLFQNLPFDNFTPSTFSYTPPASCPGPWAKVVFTADFTVQSDGSLIEQQLSIWAMRISSTALPPSLAQTSAHPGMSSEMFPT